MKNGMRKRISALVMTLVMAVSSAVMVSAAEPVGSVDVNLELTQQKDTVYAAIKLENNTQKFNGIQIKLLFDKDQLEYIGAEDGDTGMVMAHTQPRYANHPDPEYGGFYVAVGNYGFEGTNATLATAEFRIKENADNITICFDPAKSTVSGNTSEIHFGEAQTLNPKQTYPITVTGGKADPAQAAAGKKVKLQAEVPAGMVFDKWSSSDVTVKDAEKEKTTFEMPAKAVSVTASFKEAPADKPAGGGGAEVLPQKKQEITVLSAENGTTAADKKTAEKGESVLLSVKPAEGFKLDTLTVLDAEKNAVELTKKTDAEYTFLMPESSVTVEAAFVKAEAPVVPEPPKAEMDFKDVKETDWYHGAVAYAVENGLMSGISAEEFGPNVTTSRGMIVTILWRMEGKPATEGKTAFADVAENAYYADAVKWAAENGVVSGYSDTVFAPNKDISRQEMASILYRYAKYKGLDVTADAGVLDQFADHKDAASYAEAPLSWAVEHSIISGMDGKLVPEGKALRAQAASILMRFCEKIVK